MAELDMTNATYARNTDQKSKLQLKVRDEFQKYGEKMTNCYTFNTLSRIREELWVGEDSNAFWSILEQRIKNVQASCNVACNKICQIIDDDYSKFYTMQNNNGNNIKKSK